MTGKRNKTSKQKKTGKRTNKPPKKVVGLIPAAGRGSRLAPLPCSKELLPIGWHDFPDQPDRPKVVGHYLLEHFAQGGINEAIWIIADDKPDIPRYFADGGNFGLNLAYCVTPPTPGTPYTVNQALPMVGDAVCALGFPDILFESCDAYARVLGELDRTDADVVLGLFPTDNPQGVDMVLTKRLKPDRSRRVREIVIKPEQPIEGLTWGIAVWGSTFSAYLTKKLEEASTDALLAHAQKTELYIGDVLQWAIQDGIEVRGMQLSYQNCIDTGTPDGLRSAQSRFG